MNHQPALALAVVLKLHLRSQGFGQGFLQTQHIGIRGLVPGRAAGGR